MKLPLLSALLLSLATTSLLAATPEDTIRTNLNQAGQSVLAVQPSSVKGLYFVVTPQGPIYVDEAGQHVIAGQLFDMQSRAELGSRQLSKTMPKIAWDTLPLQDAVKVVKGNGRRKLAVFADPDCPYCKMLEERSLSQIDNVTIYTFLYPLASLHPDAARKAGLIWCAPDRAGAWNGWMLNGALPAGEAKCDTPLARNGELGRKLWVFGTPVLFFQNGERLLSAMPAAEIEKHL